MTNVSIDASKISAWNHFPCSKAKQSQWSRRRRTNGAAMFSENSFSIAAPEWLPLRIAAAADG
jgi:hypothetical protein